MLSLFCAIWFTGTVQNCERVYSAGDKRRLQLICGDRASYAANNRVSTVSLAIEIVSRTQRRIPFFAQPKFCTLVS